MYVCMYVRTYVCMYVRTYVCMYVCVYVYICIYTVGLGLQGPVDRHFVGGAMYAIHDYLDSLEYLEQ